MFTNHPFYDLQNYAMSTMHGDRIEERDYLTRLGASERSFVGALRMALDHNHYHVARSLLDRSSEAQLDYSTRFDHMADELEDKYSEEFDRMGVQSWHQFLVVYVEEKIKEQVLDRWAKVRTTFLGPSAPWAYAKHWMLVVANLQEERRIAMVRSGQLDF